LHIFLTCINTLNGHVLKGFVFLETPTKRPPNISAWPAMGKCDAELGVQYDDPPIIRWIKMDDYRFTTFRMVLKRAKSPTLIVNGTSRHFPLNQIVVNAQSELRGKNVLHVLSSSHGPLSDLDMFAKLVTQHIEYHRSIGILSTIYFCRKHLCHGHKTHKVLQDLISDSKLELLEWDEVPQVDGWPYYDQALQYNYAALSYFGRGVSLFIADLDEFVAIKGSRSIFEHLNLDIGCSELARFNIFVSQPSSSQDLHHPFLGSSHFWANRLGQGKSIINPDNILGVYVHEGVACGTWGMETGCESQIGCKRVDAECARVAHHANLISNRTAQPLGAIVDQSWLNVSYQL
jgi:hypothetical protein